MFLLVSLIALWSPVITAANSSSDDGLLLKLQLARATFQTLHQPALTLLTDADFSALRSAGKFQLDLIWQSGQLSLVLEPNGYLVTKDLKARYINEGAHKYYSAGHHTLCFYTGHVINQTSHSSLSLCEGISGVVHAGDLVYRITSHLENGIYRFFLRISKHSVPSGLCDHDKVIRDRRSKRAAVHGPAGQSVVTRYIELYLVVDRALFLRSGGIKEATDRAIHIANYASSLFRHLDIYIALVGLEIWNEEDKIDLKKDVADVLTDFSAYRRQVKVYNDNAQLLAGKYDTTALCSVHAKGTTEHPQRSFTFKVSS